MQALKRPALAVCLLLLLANAFSEPVAAKETWTKVRSKNFTLVGNAGEKEIRQVATRLEQFRDVFSRLFTGARLNTHVPTTVVIFKNFDSYKPFNPRGNVGYFQPGEDVNYITLTLDRGAENPYHIIFHEYVHLIVDNNMPAEVPLWFNEGLAEYYSTFEMRDDDKKVVLGYPIDNHILYLREQKMLPLRTLLAVDHASPHYNERDKRGVFYAESWALMHYLMRGKNEQRREQLRRYINLLGQGMTAEGSFKQVFEADTSAIEKELKDYIRQSTYLAQQATFEKRLEFESGMEGAPLTEAEAQGYLGDLLVHMGEHDKAEPYLQKAISLDPNLTLAHASLGLLRVRQGRYDESKPHFERAVSADTQNHLAHYYYAYALLHEQTDNSRTVRELPAATAEKMRLHLRKAIEIAPEFAEAYDMLAFVNMMREERLDESVALVKRALALAPGRQSYTLTLAQLYMRKRDFKAARPLLDALKENTGVEPQLRASARTILDTLNAMEKFSQEVARDNEAREKALDAGDEAGTTPKPDEERPKLSRRSGTQTSETEVDAALETSVVSTLRPRRDGEEQSRGLLTRIDCSAKGITFQVKVGERLLRLFSANFERIQFVTYTTNVSGELSCGARNPANDILITYRPSTDARAKLDGELVAVDFIPKDWK